MNSKQSQTWLCWHCDAAIPKGSHLCPFCGNSLEIPSNESSPATDYSIPVESPIEETHPTSPILPLILSLLGSTLFVFSLILWLFNNGGMLEIRWNAQFWPLYMLIGAASLGWAIKKAL